MADLNAEIRLRRLWHLRCRRRRRGGRNPIQAKPNQGQQDRAKNKTEENAWIKETGLRSVLFFHKGFFVCLYFGSVTIRYLFTKLSEWPNRKHQRSWRKIRKCFFMLADWCWFD